MTHALGDILPQGKYQEPPEVAIIKQFVHDKYQQPVGVTVQPNQIILQVRGAALAGTLRMHLHELKDLCMTDKRLLIRIV